jgi:hypothetical protein
MMRVDDRWVSTFDVDEAIREPDWLDFYRMTQHGPEHFEVQVIPALGGTPDFKDLASRLKRHFNPEHLQFRVASRFDPLRSMKIGLTRTRLGGAPELP